MADAMDSSGGGGGSWAPGSPRLSFSRDFVQSEVFNPCAARRDRDLPAAASPDFDFEFGMLALLRGGGAREAEDDCATPMLPADELISNGRLLPMDRRKPAPDRAGSRAGSDGDIAHLVTGGARESQQQPRAQQQQVPPKSLTGSSSRWKDLLTLNFMRSSSPSSISISIPISGESESEALSSSARSSLSSKPGSSSFSSSSSSRLKLLFRSSSAGAGSRQSRDEELIEPCLGRSASESKVASCCNNLRVADGDLVSRSSSRASSHSSSSLVGERDTSNLDHDKAGAGTPRKRARARSSSSPAPLNPHPQLKQQHPRKALAEVKSRAPSSSSSSSLRSSGSQRLASNHGQIVQAAPSSKIGVKNSSDALRSYGERVSNATSNGHKVAEVLHMEVCMGQSTVVSKVAKAFTKKENAPQSHFKVGSSCAY